MADRQQTELSIVIPVYGSEEVLPELVAQIYGVLGKLAVYRDSFEIIFVCDNSPDNSWKVIQSLSKNHSWVKGVLLRMNAGQHNAIMAGLSRAHGKVIVTMDDDLQHAPADIPALLDKLNEGHDVAYAKFKKRKHAWWKIIGSRLNDLVAGYLMQKPKNLYLSPFRAMKSVIRDDIVRYQGPYVYVDGLILAVTRNVGTIDVGHHERYAGNSGYSLRKSISLCLKMATSFSIVPLRITSFAGLFFAVLGFVLAVLLIIQKLTIDVMPVGWSSLVVTILIMGGVQLVALGMLGEYLGRVLLTINLKPQYIVADVTDVPR